MRQSRLQRLVATQGLLHGDGHVHTRRSHVHHQLLLSERRSRRLETDKAGARLLNERISSSAGEVAHSASEACTMGNVGFELTAGDLEERSYP